MNEIIEGIFTLIGIGIVIILFLIFVGLIYLLIAGVIMLAWNYVFGAIYPIHFWQALILWLLCNFLLGGRK